MTEVPFRDARKLEGPKRTKRDQAAIQRAELERQARVQPEPEGISFATGPVTAECLASLLERVAARARAMPPEAVLFAHVHQGEQHRDGCVVTFYPIVTFQERSDGWIWDATPAMPELGQQERAP